MVVLYSNHCPLCDRLKELLIELGEEYREENDVEIMTSLGIDRTPRLGVDVLTEEGEQHILLKYALALKWLNNPEERRSIEQRCLIDG